ncbi:hypothetical protein CYY_009711 [Polysphondylium violaceum]|uniref:SPX domain-containing protein n=1 Tax=Polysphondylium violaceum TaxID=133409 RepID=A0A8J4UPB1_9MYCE|nr:hypothetical protein CYY_009711 [Polysphondylium violaceum]
MKFGKYLKANIDQKLESNYINYKELKKLLMDLALEESRDGTNSGGNNRVNNRNYILQHKQSQKASDRNSKFLFAVWNQFQRVDRFLQEFERDTLTKANYMENSVDASLLIETIKEVNNLLANFIELNKEGFRKILKKFDKKFTISIGAEYYKNMIQNHFIAKTSILNHYKLKLINIYSNHFGDPQNLISSEQSESVFDFTLEEQ